MVNFLINRPIAVIMTLIALLVLGAITAMRMPVSLLPPIDIPEITVQISYPNSDARSLENSIVKPVRQQLLQVNSLKDIQSETRDGSALIKLRFAYNTDIHLAYIETNEKIDGIMNMLPRDMERPKVLKASASDIPVFYVSIIPGAEYANKYGDLVELSRYTENVLKKRIEQLSEVAMVDVSGLEYPEIVITPDREKLKSLNLTDGDIERTLNDNNITVGNIMIKDGRYLYNVRISSEIKTVDDIRNIFMNTGDRLIKMKDIADIRIKPKQRKGLYLFDDNEAIIMAIIKQADARMTEMHEKLHSLIDKLQAENPGLMFRISRDRSQLLAFSMNNLKQTLLLGLFLSIVIMFFFMRNMKAPFLIGISIPAALVISIFFLYLSNISINIVSISGLILGVGMMIDNSIIVIDNINQYRRKGYDINRACTEGTNEVIRPLLSSVLTTVAVFVPLVFLSDISGALFFDQAVTVSVSLFVSLLVSIMILPVFYRLFYRKSKITGQEEFGTLENRFENGVMFVLKRKILFVILFLLLIPAGYFLFKEIDKQFMPATQQTGINIRVNWNEPVGLTESKKRVIELFNTVATPVLIKDAFIGEQQFMLNSSFENSASGIQLYFKTETKDSILKIKEEVSEFLHKRYPDASFGFSPEKNVFTMLFSGNETPLIASIRSANRNSYPAISEVTKLTDTIAGTVILSGKNPVPLKTVINISVDFEKLHIYGVSYNSVISKLKTVFNRNKAGVLKSGKSFIDIMITGDSKDIFTIIGQTDVMNKNGEMINIGSLINIGKKTDYKYIKADRQGEYIPLNIDDADFGNYEDLQKSITQIAASFPGLEVTFTGALFKDIGLFKQLSIVLMISVLLLFFILAAQFESIVQPLIVLTEIALDIAGALIVLMLFGSSLNVMSAIGIIVMSGIIINDSILKIDTINHYYNAGKPLLESIALGGKRRIKPILMTSLTTILALLPLLFFSGLGVELQRPLALAIIGGMFFGTIVSLYFIPLLYFIIYSSKTR